MASPYSKSQSIIADFVPTAPSPSNPHSVISSESEGSPALTQQTYLSPHSIIPSSDTGLSSPASSSATATTTRSPQTVSTGPDHPDSKQHQQQPVIYNAYAANNSNSNLATAAGSPGLWSQSTNTYYPPPPPHYDDQAQYAKATLQQEHLQQPQQQQQQQQQIFQPQYQQQQQQYQQYHQQQQPPSTQSFPMYPVGHPNATTAISHNINDSDHLKPPIDNTHMEILGSVQHHQSDKDKKKKKKKKKKCLCFLILVPVIIGIILGIVFGVILKKNNNNGEKSPNPSTSGGGGSSTTTTTTATGLYPYPTGVPDMTNCILACQKALTDCIGKCGTNSACTSDCSTKIYSCSLGCAGL